MKLPWCEVSFFVSISELSNYLLIFWHQIQSIFSQWPTYLLQKHSRQSRVDQYPPDRCCRVVRWAPLRRQAARGCRWRPTDSFQRGLNVRFPWRRSSFDMKLGALKSLEVNSFSSAQHHFRFLTVRTSRVPSSSCWVQFHPVCRGNDSVLKGQSDKFTRQTQFTSQKCCSKVWYCGWSADLQS